VHHGKFICYNYFILIIFTFYLIVNLARNSSLGSSFDNFYNRISSTLENFHVPAPSQPTSTVSTPYARPPAPHPTFTPSSSTLPSYASPKTQIITPEGSTHPTTFTSPAASVLAPRSTSSHPSSSSSQHSSHSPYQPPTQASSQPSFSSHSVASTPTPTHQSLNTPSDSSPLLFRSSFSDLAPFYATLSKNAAFTTSTLDQPSTSSSGQEHYRSGRPTAISGSSPSTIAGTPGMTNIVPPIIAPFTLSKSDTQNSVSLFTHSLGDNNLIKFIFVIVF
jgi:hypothetical protein